MSDPNRHHYIPQFYLRRWADPQGLVSSYSWQGGKVYIGKYSPKSVGAEHGLYALEGVPPEMRNILEREFMGQQIDTPAADALFVLLGERPGPLSPELRIAWVRFLVSLTFRIPDQLAALKTSSAATLRAELEASPHEYTDLRRPDDPPRLRTC